MSSALELAGERAAQEAERMWTLDVVDLPIGSRDPRMPLSLTVINSIITVNGWSTNVLYRGNGPPQWCGMFAGACWRVAGLDVTWLQSYFASTSRLITWARYQRFSATSKPNPPAPRNARGDEIRGLWKLTPSFPSAAIGWVPRRGDIVLVGDGDPASGDHVTMVVGFDSKGRTFETISGNGGGLGPKGDHMPIGGGIGRATYSIDALKGFRAMWAVRPAFGDLLAERPI